MELEQRIELIEDALARETAKRQTLVTEVLVLRAALIGITITADTSSDRHTAAKARAMDRLAAYLMASEYPPTEAQEALLLLEDTFYEIAVAQNGADQTQPAIS